MSSLKKVIKGAIVLFQHGIFGTGNGLDYMVNRLSEKVARNYKFEDIIDMDDYHPTGYDDRYYFSTPQGQLNFNNTMSKLVKIAKDNPSKNILVRTWLSSHDLCAPIHDQKKRLVHIVKYLHQNVPDIPIILVGHSQGGIVNAEASLECPTYINRIISINSPFMANKIGIDLLAIVSLLGIKGFTWNGFEYRLDEKRFRAALENLTSVEYFSSLEMRWLATKIKPKAIGIVGLSGVLTGTSFDMDQTFDGLVCASDFKYLTLDHIEYFYEKKPNCPFDLIERVFNRDYKNYCSFCDKICVFPKASFSSTLFDVVKSVVANWFSNGFHVDYEKALSTNEKLKAISAGINDQNYTGKEQKLYKIYSDKYNHKNIISNEKMISYLAGIIGL